jgi:hypothetical protein
MSKRIQSGNTNKNFAGGVTGGFLVLSIRNSRFWLRRGRDAETPIPDPVDGRHATQVDVVLVNGSERLAKAYYAGVYAAGNADQPDCWSMDSVRPDPSVMHPINPTCQNCPMNEYKRDIGGGKFAKNCSDHRRVAVTFLNELTKPDPTIIFYVCRSRRCVGCATTATCWRATATLRTSASRGWHSTPRRPFRSRN